MDLIKEKPSVPKPSEAFYILCNNIDTPLFIRCDCTFSYGREDKDYHFSLPVKIKDDEMFDEARGIRFVKLQQDKILWENYIDLVEKDLMIHRVKYAQETKCSADLPLSLLKLAKNISKRT
jgi:acetone carboxylase gamma subunit